MQGAVLAAGTYSCPQGLSLEGVWIQGPKDQGNEKKILNQTVSLRSNQQVSGTQIWTPSPIWVRTWPVPSHPSWAAWGCGGSRRKFPESPPG